MSFEQTYNRLVDFIKVDPYQEYRLSIGTDSQVSKKTVFVTAIHLHRIGKGAIGFINEIIVPRRIESLREKIFKETSLTLEVASMFTPERLEYLCGLLVGTNNCGDICFEFHIDVGTSGATRSLIKEMVTMAKGTLFVPKIKPESYAASCYANKYTKIF